LWEQTVRFAELVNSGKQIRPRQLLLIAVACLRRVRHLMPDHARAVVDELDSGPDPNAARRPAELGVRPPHASDPGQEVTNAVAMVADAVRAGGGPETWTVQQVADRCSRAVGFHARPARPILSFPLPPEMEEHRSGVAAAVGSGDTWQAGQLLSRSESDPVRVAYEHLSRELRDDSQARWRLSAAEEAAQCGIARDVLGYPEAVVSFDPAWRTGTTVAFARTLYEGRDFSGMPILADALQDAGCEDAEVLGHCRSDRPHYRGCWVLDHILGLR
jgi:hypothetical protein